MTMRTASGSDCEEATGCVGEGWKRNRGRRRVTEERAARGGEEGCGRAKWRMRKQEQKKGGGGGGPAAERRATAQWGKLIAEIWVQCKRVARLGLTGGL